VSADDSVNVVEEKTISSPTWSRRRLILVMLVSPFLSISVWECMHRLGFGDFFSYGYHVDLVEDRSDVGVPRQQKAYCLRVGNYSLFPLKFEAIQTPNWGIFDREAIFHDQIEKWDDRSQRWVPVGDSSADPARSVKPNSTKTVWPGQAIYPSGCYELASVDGINDGDIVRLAAFTLYLQPPGALGQRGFYSPPLTIRKSP
jgi:hypothetical protein